MNKAKTYNNIINFNDICNIISYYVILVRNGNLFKHFCNQIVLNIYLLIVHDKFQLIIVLHYINQY